VLHYTARESFDGPAKYLAHFDVLAIHAQSHDHSIDAALLYDKLEQIVLPLFVDNRDDFIDVMRHAIALNGSFFNTHRMLQQYALKAYL